MAFNFSSKTFSAFKAVLILIFVAAGFNPLLARKAPKAFNVVFIGNSITQGVQLQDRSAQSPPARTADYLNAHGYNVRYANCGVSGKTTVDFLPSSVRLYSKVVAAADTLGNEGLPLIFSIMLGTNDSAVKGPKGAPVSPDNYRLNLLSLIDSLTGRYPQCRIILHRPIWYSTTTHNTSVYLAEGLARLQSYTPELEKLTQLRPQQVRYGDQKAYAFFEKHHQSFLIPEKGNSGIFYLHPNAAGAEKLGEFWAKAIIKQAGK